MTEDQMELNITRTIKAPRATVWEALTVPRHIEEWLCPKPWQARIVEFELKPGGAYCTQMDGPDGDGHYVPGCFLEIVPLERFVTTTCLSGGWRPAECFLGITSFFTLSDSINGTEYSARVLHKDAEDCKRHLEMGFEDGWGTMLKQLDIYAQSL